MQFQIQPSDYPRDIAEAVGVFLKCCHYLTLYSESYSDPLIGSQSSAVSVWTSLMGEVVVLPSEVTFKIPVFAHLLDESLYSVHKMYGLIQRALTSQ